MRNKVALFALPILSVSIFLPSCVSTVSSDLRFSSLELIEVPEVTRKEIDRGRYTLRQGYIPRLRLNVASTENILAFARKEGVGISVNIFFCESPDQKYLIGRSDILVGEKSLDEMLLSGAPISNLRPNESGDYIYSVVLGLYSPEIEGGSIKLESYDLVTNPRDLCLIVELKSLLRGYESETLRISKKEIVQAISTANLP